MYVKQSVESPEEAKFLAYSITVIVNLGNYGPYPFLLQNRNESPNL